MGGVGQLFQGDLDLGRLAIERLGAGPLPPGVAVEELHYGAVAVAQRLEELRPHSLVLVGAEQRDRRPGAVVRRRIDRRDLETAAIQQAVQDAVTGYVRIDLVVDVATALDVLPARTVAIEVEPSAIGPIDHLSPDAERALDTALDLVRAEIHRAPLLGLADEIRAQIDPNRLEPSSALEAMTDLLAQLELLDREGRWGSTFAERDRLRLRIALGETGEGMSHLDWGLWWTLIEELDRIQGEQVAW